jgi:signal transduction histidine kinase
MTYRILQLHHGQLDVESVPGEGSTFTLRVPINLSDSRLRGLLETNATAFKGPRE